MIKMSKKLLKEIPMRNRNETLQNVTGVFVFPTKEVHDSGWMCMNFVAEFKDRDPIRFGEYCDSIRFEGTHFKMDCQYPNGVIHIWNSNKNFSISDECSTISFREN